MQPPPTPLHRNVFPVPTRRTRSLTSLRTTARSTPVSQLLVAALAISIDRTWVLGDKGGGSGGFGWLVLAYWGGTLERDARRRWNMGGKGKAWTLPVVLVGNLVLGLVVALQSIAFFHSVGMVGPLRSTVILHTGWNLATFSRNDASTLWTSVPMLLASSAILGATAMSSGAISMLSPGALLGTTLFAGILQQPNSVAKEKRTQPVQQSTTILAGALATILVISLWGLGMISRPFPMWSGHKSHFFASVSAALLARNVPLSATSTSSSTHISRLRVPRDGVILVGSIAILQLFALPPAPTRLDALLVLPLSIASTLLIASPTSTRYVEISSQTLPSKLSWSFMKIVPPTWKPHLQTILHTPTSKRIFYFLLLNLAYMGVQMAYGVLTNSLGLISDAIHMLFDCLGLAVGLWASVAATWKPDGRYTFGYSRVETLSGFTNGLFLILISVFIIFEAIQRVIDPPEMETNQLLLVSSIGLFINLWGMYATGGHHHHGHSHGHSHTIEVNEKKVDHRHTNGDGHHHEHKNSHGSSKDLSIPPTFASTRRRSSGQGHFTHSRSHPHDLTDDHHDHSACNGQHHTEGHGHRYTHNPNDERSKAVDVLDHDHHDYPPDHAHNHDTHSHAHTHDHAHSHNMRGVFLHVLADTLGSVGVIVSTILIRLTGWTGFDPLASLFIAALIMASVIPLVIDAGRILCLDVASETEGDIRSALGDLSNVDGLSNYGSARFWPRCEGALVGSIHIQLAPSPSSFDPSRPRTPPRGYSHGQTIYANAERVVARVEKVLRGRIRGLTELVVQIEGSEEKGYCSCMTSG